jgi:hypothetical protein
MKWDLIHAYGQGVDRRDHQRRPQPGYDSLRSESPADIQPSTSFISTQSCLRKIQTLQPCCTNWVSYLPHVLRIKLTA